MVPQVPLEQICPFGQALVQLPQCMALVLKFTHSPLHTLRSCGQPEVQWPPTQTSVAPQAVPQAPQFCGWVNRSTQPLPHFVRLTAQVPSLKSVKTGRPPPSGVPEVVLPQAARHAITAMSVNCWRRDMNRSSRLG